MLKSLYTIYDQKTREYLHPFMSINEDTAKRDFYNTMSQIPNMSQHPQDFALYQIGSFETDSGEITSQTPVQFLINGIDCLKIIQQGSKNETPKIRDDAPILSGAKS